MSCCESHCAATAAHFGDAAADRDLTRYRKKGPDVTTRLLLESLRREVGPESTLLDVGGGIGVASFELLAAGVRSATLVEASPSYVARAESEARARKWETRLSVKLGDFVALAGEIDSADFVVLDRVICCYPDHAGLLGGAAHRCRRFLAMTYPRDRWYVKAMMALENWSRRLKRNSFRVFVHPPAALEATVRASGFRLVSREGTWVWRAELYVREAAGS